MSRYRVRVSAVTASLPTLADGIEAAASATGIRPKLATGGPAIPVSWLLVMLLLGGGGGSIIGGSLLGGGGDSAEALARVAAVEAQVARVDTLETKVASMELEQAQGARQARDQARTLLWIVTSQQKMLAAIGMLAEAQGVVVDLVVPPLLPAGVLDSSP